MKAFQNSERVVVRVKINNPKIDEFNTRVNESIINPRKVVNCFNNIPSELAVVELVNRIKKISNTRHDFGYAIFYTPTGTILKLRYILIPFGYNLQYKALTLYPIGCIMQI